MDNLVPHIEVFVLVNFVIPFLLEELLAIVGHSLLYDLNYRVVKHAALRVPQLSELIKDENLLAILYVKNENGLGELNDLEPRIYQ